MRASVRTIYAHGIDVLAGFIVGFDKDAPETFGRQYRFIVDSGIRVAMGGLLTALPHTPAHGLRRDGAPPADGGFLDLSRHFGEVRRLSSEGGMRPSRRASTAHLG
jgi:hypothetical protein